MIPYSRQTISQADIDSVAEVLRSDFLTQGVTVPRFEEAVTEYCGAQHAVAVNSATSALHVACLALDLGPNNWLWTSPNSFVASANCALYCGANVDFVDIDKSTYNMSVVRLRQKLEQAEKQNCLPKVVVPVHFAGQSCDMESIYALSQKYGFKIIEDASHAVGASYCYSRSRNEQVLESKSHRIGACAHSHITIFSFHPVKIITSGEGGMAVTNDDKLADRMRRLRAHGISSDETLMHPRPEDEIWNYQQIELGFNYRMTDVHAALGLSQMERLDEFVERRREIAAVYDLKLKTLPITLPNQELGSYSSYHLYPVRICRVKGKKTQRQIYNALRQNRIAANLHYIPIHRQPYFEKLGFKKGDFPEAEQFHREVISLPIHPMLLDAQQAYVIDVLKELYLA